MYSERSHESGLHGDRDRESGRVFSLIEKNRSDLVQFNLMLFGEDGIDLLWSISALSVEP